MSSNIDATKPQQGSASTENVRINFAAAVSEIEALQNAIGVDGGSGGTVNIDGGTIDGTVIGGATAAAGTFTALTTSTSANLKTVKVEAGGFPSAGVGPELAYTGGVSYLVSYDRDLSAYKNLNIDCLALELRTNGTARVSASTSEVTVNESGGDIDFRVESTGSANMLKVDAGNDQLLVGGNVGVGVTPESWNSSYSAQQIGGLGALWGTTSQAASSEFHASTNVYYDAGGDPTYIVEDEASEISQQNGVITLKVVASGSADTTITWVTGIQIAVDGGVLMPNLPTSDPTVAGELYNDSGTLKISAG